MRARRVHPLEPWSRLVQIPLTQLACLVQQDPRVMDDFAVARPEFDRLDVLPLVDRHRQDEVAEDIVPLGRNRERLPHGDDEIRLPQLPAVREPRRRRALARVSLDGARVDPFPDRLDIVVVEPALALEMTELGVGLPRRHEPVLGGRHDLLGSLLDVAVAQQRERGGFAWPMAGSAVLENDWGDVPIEGQGTLGGLD